MTAFHLHIEINSRAVADYQPLPGALVTPPIDESYWILRVQVSKHGQAVVLFPKFSLFGIGFQYETDWNTNLPPFCTAEKIRRHIWHNRRDRIPASRVLAAIRLLQDEIVRLTGDVRHCPERYPDGSERDYWDAHPRKHQRQA